VKPSNDREAVTLILQGLVDKGHVLDQVQDDTWSSDPADNTKVSTVAEAVELVMGVDEAFVIFENGYIYFVMGNDPEEVACDYTVNLDPDLSNITDPWWK
jgi:hypothetical protein